MSAPTDEDRIAALLAIRNPVQRAAAITAYGRTRRLPKVLANRRIADLAHGRLSHSASQLAALVGLAKSGIHRLAPLQSSTEGATS